MEILSPYLFHSASHLENAHADRHADTHPRRKLAFFLNSKQLLRPYLETSWSAQKGSACSPNPKEREAWSSLLQPGPGPGIITSQLSRILTC